MSIVNQPIADFSSPSATHISLGPQVEIRDIDFEIQPYLIRMVQAITFSGKPHEDANTHLQNFLEVCSTIAIKGVTAGAIRHRLFPFSLLRKAKQWFYALPDDVDTWSKCATAFLNKFFPMSKTSALQARIYSFCQKAEETIPEAWERLQKYIQECPHHQIKEWLLIQGFYHGLTPDARSHLDAAARGSFTSLNVAQAKNLIENIVSNQEWNDERPKPKKRGTHTIEEVKAISQNIELLMKKMEETSNFKKDREAIQQYTSARVVETIQRCEVRIQQWETTTKRTDSTLGQGNFQKSS